MHTNKMNLKKIIVLSIETPALYPKHKHRPLQLQLLSKDMALLNVTYNNLHDGSQFCSNQIEQFYFKLKYYSATNRMISIHNDNAIKCIIHPKTLKSLCDILSNRE